MMTLYEARRKLRVADLGCPMDNDEDYHRALKLAVEAMDYIRRERWAHPGEAYTVLEGETEE